MKTVVEYFMKGEPRATRQFETRAEANAFMIALNDNPNCEGYGIVR